MSGAAGEKSLNYTVQTEGRLLAHSPVWSCFLFQNLTSSDKGRAGEGSAAGVVQAVVGWIL